MKYRMSPREVADRECESVVISNAPGDSVLELCGIALHGQSDLKDAVRRLIEQDRQHVKNTVELAPTRI